MINMLLQSLGDLKKKKTKKKDKKQKSTSELPECDEPLNQRLPV